jgi:hypothetical protein
LALEKVDALHNECPDRQCTSAKAQDDLSFTRTWANVSTASFAVAGGGALFAFITATAVGPSPHKTEDAARISQRPSASPWFGIGALGVRGRF